MKRVGWLLSEIVVVQVMEVRTGSKRSYRISRWLYECVCEPSFEASINTFGKVIELHASSKFRGQIHQVKDHRPGDCLRTREK